MSNPSLHVCGLVAYDGTDYHGFQLQVGVPTVQGTLEAAFQAVTGESVRVTGSGRTDSGVHARGQVIAAIVPWRHSVQSLQRALNANLPSTIAIRQLREAPEGFHPRFSALRRTYRYTVYDRAGVDEQAAPRQSPLTDRFALSVSRVLDVAAMQMGVDHLLGEHDFATFGQPPQGENTVRYLYQAEWQAVRITPPSLSHYPGRCLVFTVSANAFLRQMVRNLVGVSLAVGQGKWQVTDVQRALLACDRSQCTPPAPAHGLVLESVSYAADLNLWKE
ncbi:MAG: tRNA pseudouridine(38-40) synthase TruA [Caldilineaceae bacterium]|nr:tRNA pseudouridine(38-40) synthase TruA [Caldilineaceae bacterium]